MLYNQHMRMFVLFWLSLAFIAGILLAGQVAQTVSTWLILAGAALFASIITYLLARRRAVAALGQRAGLPIIPLVLVSFFVGAARYQYHVPEINPNFIAWYNDREYETLVTGVLVEPPDVRDTYQNLRLKAESIDTGNQQLLPVSGLFLARLPVDETYQYGDRLRLRGYLATPAETEEFSYRDYLARHGIYSTLSRAEATRLPGRGGNAFFNAVYTLKGRALENIYRIFPDPEASLLAGILLGADNGLSPGLQQAFKDTGTAHIIAISGFNIAIIAGLFFLLFSRLFGQRRGAVAAVLGIAVYTVLVGADASVLRAAIMGGFSLFARQVGRRQTGLSTLTVTGAIMAFLNPLVLGDVGFQLSFGATLGLILYAQPLQDWFTGLLSRHMPAGTAQKIAGPAGEYFLFTLAAQLTTLPIMAYHFQRISLVSLIANPFILPFQPPVMILGGLALLFSLIFLPLGQITAWIAWPFSAYTIRMVELFHRLPNGVFILGDSSLLVVVLFYVVLFAWTFRSALKEALGRFDWGEAVRPGWGTMAALTVFGVLGLVIWRLALSVPDGNLQITFLQAGSGDSVLIQTPTGRSILINGGASVSLLSDGLGRRLPLLNRELDWLVVASTQENQVDALPRVLERYRPKNVLWAGNTESSYAARTLNKWLTDEAIPVAPAEAGQSLDLGKGAVLRVLLAGPRGAVLLVEWKNFRLLIPSGADFDTFDTLDDGRAVGPVSAMLLAESGYFPANPPEWIANLNPQLVILSVAADDPTGLPDEEVLDALAGYSLVRTDQNGWVMVTTDGEGVWVEAERPGIAAPPTSAATEPPWANEQPKPGATAPASVTEEPQETETPEPTEPPEDSGTEPPPDEEATTETP